MKIMTKKYYDLFISAEKIDGFDDTHDICKEHLKRECDECLDKCLSKETLAKIKAYEEGGDKD